MNEEIMNGNEGEKQIEEFRKMIKEKKKLEKENVHGNKKLK